MDVRDLYTRCQIMPQLQTHMLRVAGIAKLITDQWEDREIAATCVNACLVHDLGNLAKFELAPKYQANWGPVQQQFWKRYGHDAHVATYAMLQELGLSEYVSYLQAEAKMYVADPMIDDMRRAPRPVIMVLYADLRVSMTGVVSLEERIVDLQKRYGGVRAETRWGSMLEEYVQSLTKIDVREITETSVEPLFEPLLGYNVYS